jgi:hypothetical protein
VLHDAVHSARLAELSPCAKLGLRQRLLEFANVY